MTFDGTPLASGTIQFNPTDFSKPTTASGTVISNGAYKLPVEAGLPAGTYMVSITSVQPAPPPPKDPNEAMQAASTAKPPQELLPAKYNKSTGLTYEVKPGNENKANFELTSK